MDLYKLHVNTLLMYFLWFTFVRLRNSYVKKRQSSSESHRVRYKIQNGCRFLKNRNPQRSCDFGGFRPLSSVLRVLQQAMETSKPNAANCTSSRIHLQRHDGSSFKTVTSGTLLRQQRDHGKRGLKHHGQGV